MQARLSSGHMERGFPLLCGWDSLSDAGRILCRTPEELFEVLLSDYRSYEEIQITKGRREVTEDDEKLAEQFCQRLRKRWEEETK